MDIIGSLTDEEKKVAANLTEEEIEKIALESLKDSIKNRAMSSENYLREYVKNKVLYYDIRQKCRQNQKPKTLVLIQGKPVNRILNK